jgi:hypothetical protein
LVSHKGLEFARDTTKPNSGKKVLLTIITKIQNLHENLGLASFEAGKRSGCLTADYEEVEPMAVKV